MTSETTLGMTPVPAVPPRSRVTRRGRIALGLGIFAALDLWGTVWSTGPVFDGINDQHGYPDWVDSAASTLFSLNFQGGGVILILATIVTCIICGRFGGRDRLLAMVGGVLLLSPIIVTCFSWVATL